MPVLPVPSEYEDWRLWAQKLIDEVLRIIPPELLNEFTVLVQQSAVDLPKAVRPGVLIHVIEGEINVPAYSDGVNYRRVVDGSIVGTPFVRAVSSFPYNMVQSDTVIAATGTGTVVLPDATVLQNRSKVYYVSNVGAGTITVDGFGTQTISGNLTMVLPSQFQTVAIFSDGANWVEV